jgi:hypothetical protein
MNIEVDEEYHDVDDSHVNYSKNKEHNTNKFKHKLDAHHKSANKNDSSNNSSKSSKESIKKGGKSVLNDPEDETSWTKDELALRKLDMLRKLGELSTAGIKLSQNYSMISDYKTMKFEYELHCNIRSKQNSIRQISNMLTGIVKSIEPLNDNDNVNQFDMKFDSTYSNKIKSGISKQKPSQWLNDIAINILNSLFTLIGTKPITNIE